MGTVHSPPAGSGFDLNLTPRERYLAPRTMNPYSSASSKLDNFPKIGVTDALSLYFHNWRRREFGQQLTYSSEDFRGLGIGLQVCGVMDR
jgi:hypothetical protein